MLLLLGVELGPVLWNSPRVSYLEPGTRLELLCSSYHKQFYLYGPLHGGFQKSCLVGSLCWCGPGCRSLANTIRTLMTHIIDPRRHSYTHQTIVRTTSSYNECLDLHMYPRLYLYLCLSLMRSLGPLTWPGGQSSRSGRRRVLQSSSFVIPGVPRCIRGHSQKSEALV